MKHARKDYDRFQDPQGKVPEEEPVFLLRGQDVHASQAVAYYAFLLSSDPYVDPEMAATCLKWAARMRDWVDKKSPDMPLEAANEA